MCKNSLVAGSHRTPPANSSPAGQPDSDEQIQITLLLRRRCAAPAPGESEGHFSHEELAAAHGADADDMLAVELFAGENKFAVIHKHAGARTMRLCGQVGALATAFGANIELRSMGDRVIRTRQGHLSLPECLRDRVVAVFGFDERPTAATYHQVLPRAAGPTSFTPTQLTQIYNFPKGDGAGQTIALIELGGGYSPDDLKQYWTALGLPEVAVTSVSVDGAQNAPTGNPDGPDGEVVLDIEVVGAVAPRAQIAVYFAPNTDQGFLNAVLAAIHDQERKPSVLSISWGSAEVNWTEQALTAFHSAFHDAALLGITVLAAAGDNGSSDGQSTDQHVDFPASCPWVVACGGTRLIAAGGDIQSETVWNNGTHAATGGGVSSFFALPTYQAGLPVPAPPAGTANATGRGVPDIAAVADPETGYTIFLDRRPNIIGGTSAVAPLWAGLFAICNQQLGKNVGWPHDFLYGTATQHKVLNDITNGTNGAYQAGTGWDCCTGLGTPNGQGLLDLLLAEKK